MAKKKLTYEEAIQQLEQLIAHVENNETGIDELADKLKEAQQLLGLCRQKLYAADEEIKKLLDPK